MKVAFVGSCVKACVTRVRSSCAASALLVCHASSVTPAPLTLQQAWALAERANPTLQVTKANVAAAQGELSQTHTLLFNNPQITVDGAKRDISSIGAVGADNQANISNLEGSIGLSQTFELAGQQGKRRSAAEQSLSATQQTIEAIRRQIRAEVEKRFVQVLRLQQRVRDQKQALELIEKALAVTRKRITAGEASRLDGNLAKVEAERARNQVALLKEQLIVARAILARLLQLPQGSVPEARGSLEPAPTTYTLRILLQGAAHSPAVRALDFRESAAQSRLDLEHALGYPDLTVVLSYGNEVEFDSDAKITTLSLSLPLPLFNRNQSGIGRAIAELTQAQIEKQVAQRNTGARVRALWQQLVSLRARAERLKSLVLPCLNENQRLSTTAYREGEIGISQLLLVARQVLDARRDLLDARTELRLTQTALEAAAGWPSLQASQ